MNAATINKEARTCMLQIKSGQKSVLWRRFRKVPVRDALRVMAEVCETAYRNTQR